MVNPAHLAVHDDATGQFGFLDTLGPDPAAVAALTAAAEDWLRARGMARITGPFNFSVNEECGLLVEGFDSPPMLMMPHGRPDYAAALEATGYGKAIDLYAFLHDFGEIYSAPEKVQKWKTAFLRDPALTVRPLEHEELYRRHHPGDGHLQRCLVAELGLRAVQRRPDQHHGAGTEAADPRRCAVDRDDPRRAGRISPCCCPT